jgi:anti-sigma-K factor RskA
MEKEKERMLDLLADQTLFGLIEEETAELENLLNEFPEFRTDDSFEMAAAAINLINLEATDSLPAHLQTKLEAQAKKFFGSTKAEEFSNAQNKQSVADSSESEIAQNIYEIPSRRTSVWQWLGWAIAAAACFVLAINLWLTRVQPQSEIARNSEVVKTPETGKTQTPELTLAQKREQLIATAPDVIQTNWTPPNDNGKILGDVVWSSSQQKGYLRLRGLPVTNPNEETYQLWIVDESRSEKNPLSGGVFSVNEQGDVIIPIEAQLEVKKPKVFAITKEKPGGVVVSKQEKPVAIAKV